MERGRDGGGSDPMASHGRARQPPRIGEHDEVWSSVSYLGVETLYSLSDDASLRGALAVGTSAPPVTVRFADEPEAEWGRRWCGPRSGSRWEYFERRVSIVEATGARGATY